MSQRNLEFLLRPRSVAVVGASERAGNVGGLVLRNLLSGGFSGPIYPVNPHHAQIQGLQAWPNVASLPQAPDLAAICTPAPTVPGIIAALGQRGTRAAVVISAGFGGPPGSEGARLREALGDAARPHLMRLLGPNCVGLLLPPLGINASFAHIDALPGDLAFVSQSGAMVTSVLDWARSRGIGFSHFISLGDSLDVDLGDLLDYLGRDPQTRAILLYVESVRQARKFLSAARAAARNKPVLAVKAGRVPEGAQAAASHTGALAGSDDVYDAALRRAGILRVLSTEELFDAVETLARSPRLHGDRLCIVTNGGGPGVMATDALVLGGGRMAALSPDGLARLDRLLPANWSHGNPVDIIGDAPVERYVGALATTLAEPACDATLLIHSPTAIVPSAQIAAAVAGLAPEQRARLLCCWVGGNSLTEARAITEAAGIPTYATPERAAEAFLQRARHRRNLELLLEVPAAGYGHDPLDRARARTLVDAALAAGTLMLSEPAAKELLAAYGIPVVATRIARTLEEVMSAGEALGFPVALKVLSAQISHKSEVGGVRLDLETPGQLRQAATEMAARVAERRPDAQLEGFTVQRMAPRAQAEELILGATTDPTFGPIVLFGQGGVGVEVIRDRALALPPLSSVLAADLISRTRVARLLGGYRDRPAINRAALEEAIVRLSWLLADLPEVQELDINPLLADAHGVLALDARVRLAPAARPGPSRFAILPYPAHLERTLTWDGLPLSVRPIRPEDGERHQAFFAALTPEDVRLRLFATVRSLDPMALARLTQIDYDREMAFIALQPGDERTLGVARICADPDLGRAEFAVVVRSDLKGRGLGRLLLGCLIDYCRERGIGEIVGETLPGNTRLLKLASHFGFETRHPADGGPLVLHLDLRPPRAQPAPPTIPKPTLGGTRTPHPDAAP